MSNPPGMGAILMLALAMAVLFIAVCVLCQGAFR
jgi:hypothetical protein